MSTKRDQGQIMQNFWVFVVIFLGGALGGLAIEYDGLRQRFADLEKENARLLAENARLKDNTPEP